jgi:hypothetical protein
MARDFRGVERRGVPGNARWTEKGNWRFAVGDFVGRGVGGGGIRELRRAKGRRVRDEATSGWLAKADDVWMYGV